VHAVLQEVKRYAKVLQAQLLCKSKFPEAEEVFVDVLCEIAANELLASVVERSCAVCAGMIA
jgi:hypothetical protein